jgi:4-hydroxybenzoate polyprenyltransferase
MICSFFVFLLLLGFAVALMLWLERHVTSSKEPRNQRVIHFILWLALVFGIGAIVDGTLIVLSQLRL